MATERTSMTPFGTVVFLDENKDSMLPDGTVVSINDIVVAGVSVTNYYYNELLAGNG